MSDSTPLAADPAPDMGAAEWGVVGRRFVDWAKLEKDWDGEGGVAPPLASLMTAIRLVCAFQAANLPAADPFIAGDGEIGFEWRRASGTASISLLDDGTVLAYVPGDGARATYRLEAAPDSYAADELIGRIRLFA